MSTDFARQLSAAVQLDASIAILADPSLHSFSFFGNARAEPQLMRSERTQTMANRTESVLYRIVRANIYSAKELSAYETVITDACNRGFSGCSSSCTVANKEMYVNYMMMRLRFMASSFDDFISAGRSQETRQVKWESFNI